ncbi:gp53-like domain-containing protein [Chromobacterium haemolyticum]|uniref:gp53-like domain-containing protein n=1 Tax=Chromobacterium haemolyticum TaxID=394935 RepID=UPI0012FBDAC5|nr:hypothetical protein [Chromobacterium haemolyticum]
MNDKESWERIPYFAEDAVLTGGPDCPDNVPLQALANRTAFLKQLTEQAARDAQPLSPGLSALASIKNAGFYVSTGPGTATARILSAGQGITINNPDGKAGNPSVALANSGVTPSSYSIVVVDAMGRVTSGRKLTADDVPALDWGKIASGKPSTLAGYGIEDAVKTNAEGSVGVGVTPRTWGVRGPGLQLNDKGALGADFNSLYLGVNWYCDKDGIDRRLGAGCAVQIQFDAAAGAYLLKTAAKGNADAPITWKTVQRLDIDSGISDVPAGYTTDEPPANENSRRVPTTSWVQKLWTALNQVLVGKADKATTLAGYGITDALSSAPATEAAAGILKIASQAQVNAGGDASVAVTPKTLKFGFGCSLTQNGYIASPWWLGGWVFQWAVGTMTTGGDQEQTIAFPIAFPTECVHLMVSTIAGSTALSDGWFQERASTRGNCTVVGQFIGGGNLSGGITPRIFAIGR